jgi:hypothetical protein
MAPRFASTVASSVRFSSPPLICVVREILLRRISELWFQIRNLRSGILALVELIDQDRRDD